MKLHRFIGTCPLVASGFFFLSCSLVGSTDNLPFNEIKKDITTPLCTDKDSPTCSISVRIDEVSDTTAVAHRINEEIKRTIFDGRYRVPLSEAVDSFCVQCIGTYRKELLPLYDADCKQNIESDWYNYRYSFTSEYKYGAKDCLCYKLTIQRYEGGFRDAEQTHVLNFNIKNGERMKLQDVLQPTYPTLICPLLLKALQKKFGCRSLNDLHEKGILLLTDIYVPDNYLFEADGITFLYNADEIAPYETGAIRLRIASDELKSITKQEYKDLWN